MDLTSVLIVDDQPIFRVMLREILSMKSSIRLLGEASSGNEAIEAAERLKPEVVLMDIELGSEPNGVQAGRIIKARRPSTGIVLFSTHKSPRFIVNEPGWSYLLKNNVRDVDSLVTAITGASWGLIVVDQEVVETLKKDSKMPWWDRYPEPAKVLHLMAQGYQDSAIADRLSITEQCVREWQEIIYRELGIKKEPGVDPRIRAVARFIRESTLLLTTPGPWPGRLSADSHQIPDERSY